MRSDEEGEGKSNVSYSDGVMMNKKRSLVFPKRSNQVKSGVQATRLVLLIYISEIVGT
jgi:hypothetical protein